MVPPGFLGHLRPDAALRSSRTASRPRPNRRVAVVLEPRATERPVVALMTPDKPTVVLSQPAAPKPTAGAVVVEAVEIEPGGKFHVSGQARPGAALRLYLNDSFVTSVTAGADGRFAVTINEGVAPGSYRVRLDEAIEFRRGTRPRRGAVQRSRHGVTGSVTAQARRQAAGHRRRTAAAAGGRRGHRLPDSGSRPPPWWCRKSRPPPFPAATASGVSASASTARARATPSFTRRTGNRSAIPT